MINWLARLGYGAKGVVYLLVAWRTIQAGLWLTRPTGSEGAMQGLDKHPDGDPLLLVLAIGLAAFCLWRIVQTLLDPDCLGRSPKALITRAGFACSAFFYGNLASGALEMAVERPEPEDRHEQERMAAFLFDQPLGELLVALAGVAVLLTGVAQLAKARNQKFLEPLHVREMGRGERRIVILLAYLGLCARGLVFGAIGLFIVRAAWHVNPQEVQSLPEILLSLRHLPHGSALLCALGAGLGCYALYMLLVARYRRVAC